MTNLTPDDAQSTDQTGTTGGAKQMLGDASRAVRQEANQFANTTKDRARGALDRQKETATRTLGDFADAIRKAGDELGTRDQSMASNVVRQAADTLEGFSRTLADNGPDELISSVRDFGRRNPAAFLAGAVLVGLAIGRFARSSAQADAYGQTNQFAGDSDQWIGEGAADDLTAGIGASSLGATGSTDVTGMGGMAGEGGSDETNADLYASDIASGGVLTAEEGALSQGGDFTPRDPAASEAEDGSDLGTGDRGRQTGMAGEL